jgi:CheY-like chemotaxis protein
VVRILLVDDREDYRQTFAALLEGQSDLEVVAQAGSLAEAHHMLEGVDVALLDRGLARRGRAQAHAALARSEPRGEGLRDERDRGDAPSGGRDGGRSGWDHRQGGTLRADVRVDTGRGVGS